jgi:hypothetical protein
MTDEDLDALLAAPLPELETTAFSVALVEAIAQRQARPARILSWIMVGLLFATIAAAGVFGGMIAHRSAVADPMAVPAALALLTLLLSYSVLRSARE